MIALADIRESARRIAALAHRTPVLTSTLFNQASGMECFFKCENFQRGGAFKIRGACNFLQMIPAKDLEHGVVAFSSGNHAQAVAIAAAHAGVPATVIMPEDAPKVKLEATLAYGARILRYDRLRDDRETIGRRVAAETGATLIPPFDHDWIMAGQGTVALELLEQVPELDAISVCIGGGGLIAGCSTASKALSAHIRVFGVEPELANDTYLSFQRGERVGIPPPETIADGLRAPMPGALTFPVIQKYVDAIVLVTEDEIRATMTFLASRMKIVVEPSGAVAAAAALFRKLPSGIRRIGIVISGGNV